MHDTTSNPRKGKLGAFIVLAVMFGSALWSLKHGAAAPTRRPVVMSALQSAPAEPADPLAFLDDPALLAQAHSLGFQYAVAPKSNRSPEQVKAFNTNSSCTACHTGYAGGHTQSMHAQNVSLTCVDCHGGDAKVSVARNISRNDHAFEKLKKASHPTPKHPEIWGTTSAKPQIPGAKTLQETQDYIRFVNPGDLNGAFAACLSCHEDTVRTSKTSMMAHGAMLWGAALYNNGAIARKNAIFGEAYTLDGTPAKMLPTTWPSSPQGPTWEDVFKKGHLTALLPLPRWNITQPGNILRVFERGGRSRPQLGIPNPEEDPGRPEVRLSIRGLGTDVRTDPVFIGLQKTRLLDPTTYLFGTNDHPGDYRASGCSACHVVFANDRSPVHSGSYAQYGNRGKSINPDPTFDKNESGHPIEHKFTSAMPSSQCMVCHVHPGTNVVNAYFGFQWWDNEVDGRSMYSKVQRDPSEETKYAVNQHNPEESAARGLWGDQYPDDISQTGRKAGPDFLANVTDINKDLKRTQFADFHGHGWVFRAVFKQDRKGHLVDVDGNPVKDISADSMAKAVAYSTTKPAAMPAGAPVHMKDIHLEKGMACADCHFSQDVHGDGNLYGETRAAIMVDCVDCHGTDKEGSKIAQYVKLANRDRSSDAGKRLLLDAFSGAAAHNGMTDDQIIARNRTIIERHWNSRLTDGKLVQKSLDQDDNGKPKITWATVQTTDTFKGDSWWAKDSTTHKGSAELARYAHTVRKDGKTWGAPPAADEKNPQLALAHSSGAMSCYACHTSWTTACFGCHLPQRANSRKDVLHFEGEQARNYTNYNFQTLRDDVFMLGVDSTVKGHKIAPVRSSCAVLVTSKDALRQVIYGQQQTVSAEGYSGQAFSVYFPHTVRATETKQCTDCHLSKENDNNAWMAHITLQGTNSVNFIGRYAYVADGEEGFQAVTVTERDEPQAVIGSRLHEIAYPANYEKHVERGLALDEAYEKDNTAVYDLQLRGEYLYAACGPDGFVAYDVANIDNKGFSERMVTAPVSPLGQRLYVKTRFATSVTSPTTLGVDPTRKHFKENEENPNISLLYAFLYVTDKYEGLVVIGNKPGSEEAKKYNVGVATLLDGDPENNFLSRTLAFNPDGVLNGARSMTLYGTLAYICCDRGVAVVELANPLEPKLVTVLPIADARKAAFQFRYGWVATAKGLVTLDVTNPSKPMIVPGASVPIDDARDINITRTYGYVAAGRNGVVIVDLEKPEHPVIDQTIGHEMGLADSYQVRIGMTNASMYAYVADGFGGLKVLQLTDPETDPTYGGFSPRPHPRLIATYATKGPALAISKGLERDRAVDEAGNQLAVFGRRGARPFNLEESQRLYLKALADGTRVPYFVTNGPDAGTKPVEYKEAEAPKTEEPSTPGRRPFPGRR
jgi:hypothetical protein